MRIVNRLEFMELPPGTLYKKFTTPYAFEDVMVKFDSLPYRENGDGDFVCMELGSIENDGTEQYLNRLDEMMGTEAYYPLDLDCAGRDGCFEDDAMFLIYERDDIIKLRDFIASLVA